MRKTALAGTTTAVLLAAAVVPALATVPATRPARRLAVGCATGRPAVAHHAGGRTLRPQPAGGPVPCGVSTGYAGAESHIVATEHAVVFTPAVVPQGLVGTGTVPVDLLPAQSNASPAGLAVTRDAGAHWVFVAPDGVTWNPTDHADYVDPVTGRLFFEDYGPIPTAPGFGAMQEGPAHISWSPDEGATWHHTAIPTLVLPENPRFTSAPAPAGRPQPRGYPTVTYFCANTNVGVVSPVIAGRLCFDSLDGGSTWQQRSVLFTGAAPQHPECGTSGEVYSAIDGYYPQPTRDGALYVMVACGGATYLARSTDEAASFPIERVGGEPVTLPLPPPEPGVPGLVADLRIGTDDTFYLVSLEAGRLELRVSADRGRHWTEPLDLTAPGVTVEGRWALAAAGRQELAVAYLGQRAGHSTYDGFLTVTRNAEAALAAGPGPLFWSGQVNPPTRPLLYGKQVQGAGYLAGPVPFPPPFDVQFAGNDFIGATIGPDGTPWASFTQDCGPGPDAPDCVAQHDQTRGFAGRLASR